MTATMSIIDILLQMFVVLGRLPGVPAVHAPSTTKSSLKSKACLSRTEGRMVLQIIWKEKKL
jgi:hypothetical protein